MATQQLQDATSASVWTQQTILSTAEYKHGAADCPKTLSVYVHILQHPLLSGMLA